VSLTHSLLPKQIRCALTDFRQKFRVTLTCNPVPGNGTTDTRSGGQSEITPANQGNQGDGDGQSPTPLTLHCSKSSKLIPTTHRAHALWMTSWDRATRPPQLRRVGPSPGTGAESNCRQASKREQKGQ